MSTVIPSDWSTDVAQLYENTSPIGVAFGEILQFLNSDVAQTAIPGVMSAGGFNGCIEEWVFVDGVLNTHWAFPDDESKSLYIARAIDEFDHFSMVFIDGPVVKFWSGPIQAHDVIVPPS